MRVALAHTQSTQSENSDAKYLEMKPHADGELIVSERWPMNKKPECQKWIINEPIYLVTKFWIKCDFKRATSYAY